MDRKTRYIIKKCGEPKDYFWDYIDNGCSVKTDILRVRRWVRCSYEASSEYNKK